MYKPYVGDVGTAIKANTRENLSTATNISLMVLKPNTNQEVEWNTGITVVETTKIRYETIAGDFDRSGEYSAQPLMTIGTWRGRGETFKFMVYARHS